MEQHDWLKDIKRNIPPFLEGVRGKKRPGFCHYSFSGDYWGEGMKWGLGNGTFFLKIVFMLGLEDVFGKECATTIDYILSFQKKNGLFQDDWITRLSLPVRYWRWIKDGSSTRVLARDLWIAETRQAMSSLCLFDRQPTNNFLDFAHDLESIESFLSGLNWSLPWHAGSHFSHLLFFLTHSSLEHKDELIDHAVKRVEGLAHADDGFWYQGQPSTRQKINGAMKVMTGLEQAGRMDVVRARQLIDNCLSVAHGVDACDNFDIVYVLARAHQVLNGEYRAGEIKDFFHSRLLLYKNFYHSQLGAFSFRPHQAGRFYYGAPISRGQDEPDLHGTTLFLWGIALIAEVLGWQKDLKFRYFST